MESLKAYFNTEVLEPIRQTMREQLQTLMDRMELLLSKIATQETRRYLYGDEVVDDDMELEEEQTKPSASPAEVKDAATTNVATTATNWLSDLVKPWLKDIVERLMAELVADLRKEMRMALQRTDWKLHLTVIENANAAEAAEATGAATDESSSPMDADDAAVVDREEPEQPPDDQSVDGTVDEWKDPFESKANE